MVVNNAPGIVEDYFIYQPKISPANAVRLLDALRRFILAHQSMLAAPEGYSLPYVVTEKLPEIAAFLPDGAAAMDRLFTEFAREWEDKAAAPYFKARWLDLRQEKWIAPAGPRAAFGDARSGRPRAAGFCRGARRKEPLRSTRSRPPRRARVQ
jgi:hypothetical protein